MEDLVVLVKQDIPALIANQNILNVHVTVFLLINMVALRENILNVFFSEQPNIQKVSYTKEAVRLH